ncbi:uncharacterized protein LOC144136532 [Amblyomma americanum]
MPRRFTGKLCRFLFDHLEGATFGERLRWLDREAGVFQIFWRHGNGSSSTPEEDCAVFMEWHHYKTRRTKECSPMEAKQRFRAAMNKMKLSTVSSWKNRPLERNFQYRKFPKDDLDYLLKKTDQRVPASPGWSPDDMSDADSGMTSPNFVSDSDAYSEPASPPGVSTAVFEATVGKQTCFLQHPEERWNWGVALDTLATPSTSEPSFPPLENGSREYSFCDTEEACKWLNLQEFSAGSDLLQDVRECRRDEFDCYSLPSMEDGDLTASIPGFDKFFGPLVPYSDSFHGQGSSFAVLNHFHSFH